MRVLLNIEPSSLRLPIHTLILTVTSKPLRPVLRLPVGPLWESILLHLATTINYTSFARLRLINQIMMAVDMQNNSECGGKEGIPIAITSGRVCKRPPRTRHGEHNMGVFSRIFGTCDSIILTFFNQ